MISEKQSNMVRKALEKGYIGKCKVFCFENVKNDHGAMETIEVETYRDIPCKLSYEKISQSAENGMLFGVSQTIMLFLAPDIEIKSGSKIEIIQNGVSEVYNSSGEPSRYPTHQEIQLKIFKEFN